MVCNPAIRVPATCLAATIQGRRRRGRPSARGCDVGDVAIARARERLELGKEYRWRKVSLCMLFTPFEYFLSACIQQKSFAAEIIKSYDDFALPAAGAALPAAWAVGGPDVRGGRGGGSLGAGAKGRSKREGAGWKTTKEVLEQEGIPHNRR